MALLDQFLAMLLGGQAQQQPIPERFGYAAEKGDRLSPLFGQVTPDLRVNGVQPLNDAQTVQPLNDAQVLQPLKPEKAKQVKTAGKVAPANQDPTSPILRALMGLSGPDTASLGGAYPDAPSLRPSEVASQGVSMLRTGSVPKSASAASPEANRTGGGNFLDSLSGLFGGGGGKNSAVKYLTAQGMDPGMAYMIANDRQSLQTYLRQKMAGGGQTDFDQRAAAARQYGLDPNSEEGRNFILSGKLPEARGGTAEMSLQTIPITNEDGSAGLLQVDKAGVGHVTQLPKGTKISKAPIVKDTGTDLILIDPITQETIQTIPKNIAGKAEQEASGKAQGEALATYRSMSSKLPGLETVVWQLDKLADTATYTYAGQARDAIERQFGITTEGAQARTEYKAIVFNQILPLLRDTFGAQFTAAEGERLLGTLGDPDKSPAEKQVVLKAFIEQKKRDIAALAGQTGQSAPAASPNAGADPLGIR